MSEYSCNLCKKDGKETKIPADEVGVELMKAHLETEHDVKFSYASPIKADDLDE